MAVEGYFASIRRANEVVKELRQAGFKNAFVDLNEHYNNANVETNNAGTETATSNSGLVMKSQGYASIDDPTKTPLDAASPMASGMGGFEEIANINCKVVVEANSKDEGKVKQIIDKAGGRLEPPSIDIPKHVKGIDIKDFEDDIYPF